jgi:hypothetical protein
VDESNGGLRHNNPKTFFFLRCAGIYEVRRNDMLQWRWAFMHIGNPYIFSTLSHMHYNTRYLILFQTWHSPSLNHVHNFYLYFLTKQKIFKIISQHNNRKMSKWS